MKIALVTPAGRQSRNGNRNTAVRWARMLRTERHRVAEETSWDGAAVDALLALHARKSHPSIARYAACHPGRRSIVALTGTDLYRDIRTDDSAQASLRLATRLVLLQEEGLAELPPGLRAKARVVHQSAPSIARRPALRNVFEVLVIGHLREEKDPFRAALALRHVPPDSRIRIHHLGRALDAGFADEASAWQRADGRYRWLGERAHGQVRRMLARAAVMLMSSRLEGGCQCRVGSHRRRLSCHRVESVRQCRHAGA